MSDHGLLRPKSDRNWSADDLPTGTTGLRLVRILSGDRLRAYQAMDCKDGAAGIAQTLNQCLLVGEALDDEGSYGTIDLLDENSIVGEIGVADRKRFQHLKKKLDCKVESTDGENPDHAS